MSTTNSVFISYRRTNFFTARAVYQFLTSQGYDVFLDHQPIRSKAYERIIADQIATRAHFIAILTPSALKRCHEPNDWLRKEIEFAIEKKRNIVPLFFDGFDFADFDRYLTGKLSIVAQYPVIRVPTEFFKATMRRLCDDYLNVPLDVALQPMSRADALIANAQKARIKKLPPVTMRHLNAEEYFECGMQRQMEGDLKGAIHDYSRAIKFNSGFAEAYNNRGMMLSTLGYMKRAMADYTQAIIFNPQYGLAYRNRAHELAKYGYYEDALIDYNHALEINPMDATAYHGRGQVHYQQRQINKALADYNYALECDPTLAKVYNDRGIIWFKLGHLDLSHLDFDASIVLNPTDLTVYMNRAQVHESQGSINQAIDDYEIALVMNPNLASIYKHLKRLYDKRRHLLHR